MSASQTFECLIIGGGPGGLSTALALARILHTAVIFDSGVYRNRDSNHMHTVSTWDHKDPAEYRAAARKELTEGRYTSIQIKDVAIVKVEKLEDGGFKATDATGAEWVGKKLVLATGSKDEYPDIPGYQECWATGVFHCLFCHGFEAKDAPGAGILAVDDCAKPPLASNFAFQAQQFAKDVTIYTHGSTTLAAELEPLISAHNARTKHSITIEPRRIVELIKEPTTTDTITLVFEDGARETKGFLAHKAKTTVNGPFVEQLGLELTPMGDIKVGQPFPETNVQGCFAVGDCATMVKAVVVAVGGGMSAAAGVSMQLLA
ncbi:MAG: hypothetical protein M1839_006120 [Geoglossum umbratile]|nr:MAG: hypothetical protein M1839_006120 [Geoglossum umbratile]